MFGHRFLVHSCDVFLDVFGVKEASDGEPSDAGIVDVQEERFGECGLVSLRSYPALIALPAELTARNVLLKRCTSS